MAGQARKDKFLATLAGLGGSAGNGRLREALQWQEPAFQYFRLGRGAPT